MPDVGHELTRPVDPTYSRIMPTPDQVRAAVEEHAARWNARDRSSWLELFSDSVTFDDPVGAPTKHGRAAAEASWDNSFREGRAWTLHPQRIVVCGDEAAVVMHNRGVLGGRKVEVHGVEIWKVADDGKVSAVRAYFEQPTDFELDPYFRPGRSD